MSVGLYDVDFFKYHQVMFNLEIMKMATYFKGKREITVLSPTYSPERYTHFYLRKDFYDGTFPARLSSYENLEYGGLAFTKNIYVPLAEDIEVCKPDTFVYDKHKKLFVEGAKGHGAVYTSLSNNIHLRLSLDGETLWNRFERQVPQRKANIIFLHDPDIGKIKDAPAAVKYLLEKYSREKEGMANLGIKFPIGVTDINQFHEWNKLPFTSDFFSIKIQNVLGDEEFADLINSCSKATATKIVYNIADASSDKNHFVMSVLPRIFKQAIFCCRQHKKILLNIEDDFSIANEWREVVTLLNLYMSAAQSYTESIPALYVFCKNLRSREGQYRNGVMCKEDARRIFMFVMEHHPELFKLFYECNDVELKNGGFENVNRRT